MCSLGCCPVLSLLVTGLRIKCEPRSWGRAPSLPRPGSPFRHKPAAACPLPPGGGDGMEAVQGPPSVCFCFVAAAGCQLWWVYICL